MILYLIFFQDFANNNDRSRRLQPDDDVNDDDDNDAATDDAMDDTAIHDKNDDDEADNIEDKNVDDGEGDDDDDDDDETLPFPASFLNLNIPGGLSSLLPPNMQVRKSF